MRYAARTAGLVVVALAVPVGATALFGKLGALFGLLLAIVASLWFRYWLPRSAHAAFDAGRVAAAARRYRLIRTLATSAHREQSANLSLVGCAVAAGQLPLAEELAAHLDATALDPSARAVLLNNRACVLVARDPAAALALIDEATALRPDVPAIQHTRALVLLAIGRTDDAIQLLDTMRTAGELPARLEAERCRDLARAWEQKGQSAYAADYRLRAEVLRR